MKTKDLIKLLKKQAAEIAKEGHNGWGNTMLEAANRLDTGNELARALNEELTGVMTAEQCHDSGRVLHEAGFEVRWDAKKGRFK